MYSYLRFTLLLLLLLSLGGCYNKPVRHLASDVVLIQQGTSTRDDVIMYLGEPDDIEVVTEGVERWLYSDTRSNLQESIPWLGGYLGAAEQSNVIITIRNNRVENAVFSCRDMDDLKWQKNFDWQKDESEDEAEDEDGIVEGFEQGTEVQ